VAALAVVLAAAWFGRAPLLTAAARFLDVSEPPRQVDYVLVLGGGRETRPFVAAALYRAAMTRQVLVIRSRPEVEPDGRIRPTEEEVVRRVLGAHGVPDNAIQSLGEDCNSTRDEAAALARFLESRPSATVAVITNDLHTRRARAIFRKALGERAADIHFVAAPTDGFNATNWWQFEEGFATYAAEYVKLTIYHLSN
jgi:uncharacterized SAM-binding protein YcdF (DUF218 family)